MKTHTLTRFTIAAFWGSLPLHAGEADWKIASEKDWKEKIASSEGAVFEGGLVSPQEKAATIVTKMQSFDTKRSAKSLKLRSSPRPTPSSVRALRDAST